MHSVSVGNIQRSLRVGAIYLLRAHREVYKTTAIESASSDL